MNTIKLQTESVLHLPFNKYEKDFTFIINSERFETSSFFADLLSPLISSRHLIDPTLNEIHINTRARGNFHKVLNLLNFNEEEISSNEIAFIIEILSELKIEKIEMKLSEEEINTDNVIEHLLIHQTQPNIYCKQIKKEIEFISTHFNEMKEKIERNFSQAKENEKEEEETLSEYIIENIINNEHLQLEDEEELLEMINFLYLKDHKYSKLYEFVDFNNVEENKMKEFTSIFDFNDLTTGTWNSLKKRLEQKIDNKTQNRTRTHHIKRNKQKIIKEIEFKNNEFEGIFKYFQTKGNIKDEVNITCSSRCGGDPFNLLQYDNNNYFYTNDSPNSWICFEFKNHQIIPTNYVIKSNNGEDHYHLKTWNFEGSVDNKTWITLDSQTNNDSLKGTLRVHSFPISHQNEDQEEQSFKYLRIKQTGPNWYNNNDSNHYLQMTAIEIYGKLI